MKSRRRIVLIIVAVCVVLTGLVWVGTNDPDLAFMLGAPQDWLIHLKERQFAQWDARLEHARSKSDAAAVAIIREMLRGKTRERSYALSWLQDHELPPESLSEVTTELIDLLESKYGADVDLHSVERELLRIGPHAKPAVPRLVKIAKHGQPDWRRFIAMRVLAATRSDDPEVVQAIDEVRQSESYKRTHVPAPDVKTRNSPNPAPAAEASSQR
jgi:hypothetical protein